MRHLKDMKVALVTWYGSIPEVTLYESKDDPSLIADMKLYENDPKVEYKLFFEKAN